jgi:hypothetical protein
MPFPWRSLRIAAPICLGRWYVPCEFLRKHEEAHRHADDRTGDDRSAVCCGARSVREPPVSKDRRSAWPPLARDSRGDTRNLFGSGEGDGYGTFVETWKQGDKESATSGTWRTNGKAVVLESADQRLTLQQRGDTLYTVATARMPKGRETTAAIELHRATT